MSRFIISISVVITLPEHSHIRELTMTRGQDVQVECVDRISKELSQRSHKLLAKFSTGHTSESMSNGKKILYNH